MKFFLLLLCCSFLAVGQLDDALWAPPVVTETTTAESEFDVLDRAAMEARLGRKLKFSERIVVGIMKRKARKQQRRAQSDGKTDGLGVTSFVVGVGSVLLVFTNGLGLLTAIVGLALGIVSLGRINRNPGFRTGKGLAIAGIAINGGLILLAIIAFALIFAAFN